MVILFTGINLRSFDISLVVDAVVKISSINITFLSLSKLFLSFIMNEFFTSCSLSFLFKFYNLLVFLHLTIQFKVGIPVISLKSSAIFCA